MITFEQFVDKYTTTRKDGSMTNEMLGVIDLAADMHLIDNIIF